MSFFYGEEDESRARRRPLLIFLIVTLSVGAAGSLFSEPALRSWYPSLAQPSFAPPGWIFAPIWTALYGMMAVAASRVWRVTGTRSIEMAAYGVQLLLTLGWSVIFFGLHKIGIAFAEILVLDLAILATVIVFFRRDRLAGLLLIPWLGWVLFTTLLTHALLTLSP